MRIGTPSRVSSNQLSKRSLTGEPSRWTSSSIACSVRTVGSSGSLMVVRSQPAGEPPSSTRCQVVPARARPTWLAQVSKSRHRHRRACRIRRSLPPSRAYAGGVIDTHCHLTFKDFRDRVGETLGAASRRGVTGAITISTTTRDCLEALEIARAHERVWCSSGVHPLHSHEGPHVWENLRTVAKAPECVAWGELGLDLHYDGPHRAVQDAVLAEQLAFIESCARSDDALDLPIVIHCREAFEELLPVLRGAPFRGDRYVFHCFTGSAAEVRKVLDFGAFVSFTGVVTYKNAQEVAAAARLVPSDRIMVETDAPFLSPEPNRGKRPCVPAYSRDTAEFLAKARGVPWATFHEQINANTRAFFGIEAV
ncbi:MAG: TatD family deoxyribonuclease [Phycisphaerales bacterium]|nr:MAG: TatD family deoxyribonuclease [Phycisphaerales bacterium]